MTAPKRPKGTVTYNGKTYKVKSDKMEIPDFDQMETFAALQWLLRNTYPKGHAKPNPLAGLGGVLKVQS